MLTECAAKYTAWATLALTLASQLRDTSGNPPPTGRNAASALGKPRSACAGNRPNVESTLSFELRSGAFPGSGHPDVAVHVPQGFDATRRPGLVLYFHGWNGCVIASLGDDDVPCTAGLDPRHASGLSAQIDEARINALLVAVELRVDAASGDAGQLILHGGLRDLLRELFAERLAPILGCVLETDELDRVVVVAHSGGYQAAASAVRYGEIPQISEVDLLDAFYGANDVFADWAIQAIEASDRPRRFVDLYTTTGGTFERSRALAAVARAASIGYGQRVKEDDTDADLSEESLGGPIVFKRVPRPHWELPHAYLRDIVRASGFAPTHLD